MGSILFLAMKTARYISIVLALLSALTLSSVGFAHEGHKNDASAAKAPKGELVPTSSVNSEWLAEAKASYPTDVCIVSDDKLEGGDMGTPQDFVYRAEGQPDRLVRFCCKDCVKDFSEDPENYLGKLRQSQEQKPKAHSGHH